MIFSDIHNDGSLHCFSAPGAADLLHILMMMFSEASRLENVQLRYRRVAQWASNRTLGQKSPLSNLMKFFLMKLQVIVHYVLLLFFRNYENCAFNDM